MHDLEESVHPENAGENSLLPGQEALPAYPPKPLPEAIPKKNSTLAFIVSLLLFGAFYYFFVSRNIEVITWLAVIVFIHELGHYFAMKIFRYEDLSIFFIPLLGAIAGGSKEKISQKEKAIVLLAGPVPGIIIGMALFGFALQFDNYLMQRLGYAFVLINILNLLPIYPLDGGQLIKTLFLGSKDRVTTVFVLASIALLVAYALVHRQWMLLVIPYFLVTRLIQNIQLHKVRQLLRRQEINYHKTYGELTDEEYWKIRDLALAGNARLSRTISSGDLVVAENENEVIIYIKSVLSNNPLKDLSVAGIVLFLLVWMAALVVPVLVMTKGSYEL